MTIPDAPTSLLEDPQYRTGSVLGLTWVPEAENGSPILDFTISRAIENGSYSVLAVSSVNSFTVFSLTPGTTYKFKVQARNAFGLSNYSEELSLLSAYVPLKPDSPDAFIFEDRIIISWNDPETNGSPILGYRLWFNVHGSTTEFVEETTECLG
jgi:hypothetical protein